MAFNFFFTRVLAALSLVCAVVANAPFDSYVDKLSDGTNVTVAINVPSNSTTDLFFHFHASNAYQWAAFGFGTQMKGALMFVVYTAQEGKNNITVGPRIATGHSSPDSTDDVQVSILSGSGITADGLYIVNAQCTNCRKWTGGNINATSESQAMIYAVGPKSGGFASTDVGSTIAQHDSHNSFTLNLKKATGEAGVPVLVAATTQPTQPTQPSDGDDGDTEDHVFPIAVHALLLIACFLFVLPSGYLFLRVFNKVWLHAGIQTLGVVCLVAGVAAGIVYNVQVGIAITYHQVLGIITSLLVLAAFTLGLISHQHFKRRKVSSPLMKFHRMAGPSAVVFGWGTIISGFVFRGEARRILPFMVVLLAVVIFVGGIAFLMKQRTVRKAAMVTPAAQNFNAGYYQQNEAAPPSYGNGHSGNGEGVPMQTFSRPYQPPQQGGYPYPQQDLYAQKAPGVSVRHANHI